MAEQSPCLASHARDVPGCIRGTLAPWTRMAVVGPAAMATGVSEETPSTPLLSAQGRCHDANQHESPLSDFRTSGVMPPDVARARSSSLPTRVKEVVTRAGRQTLDSLSSIT